MNNCTKTFSISLLGLALLAVGCTWVKVEPEAQRVAMKSERQVVGCERLGQTTTSVRDRVAGVQRKPGKVEDELADLARTSALDMNGNTIVPDGPVRDGRRRFTVYYCQD